MIDPTKSPAENFAAHYGPSATGGNVPEVIGTTEHQELLAVLERIATALETIAKRAAL